MKGSPLEGIVLSTIYFAGLRHPREEGQLRHLPVLPSTYGKEFGGKQRTASGFGLVDSRICQGTRQRGKEEDLQEEPVNRGGCFYKVMVHLRDDSGSYVSNENSFQFYSNVKFSHFSKSRFLLVFIWSSKFYDQNRVLTVRWNLGKAITGDFLMLVYLVCHIFLMCLMITHQILWLIFCTAFMRAAFWRTGIWRFTLCVALCKSVEHISFYWQNYSPVSKNAFLVPLRIWSL